VTACAERDRYRFSAGAANRFNDSAPFDGVRVARIEGTYVMMFSERFGVLASGAGQFAAEDDAPPNRGLTAETGLGARWQATDTLAVGMMLSYQSRLEARPLLLPVPMLEWQIAPSLSLKSDLSDGYAWVLSSVLDDAKRLRVEAAGRYTSRRFRLSKNGPVPDGAAEDARIALEVACRFRPAGGPEMAALAGVDIYQKCQVIDAGGRTIDTMRSSPAPLVGLSVDWTF
jgi:hypothetical protein